MTGDFWDRLPALLLHDTQVAIIEAFLWIDDRPLSASDFVALYDDEVFFLSKLSYHVKRLAKLDVLVYSHSRPRRGATEYFYELNRPTPETEQGQDATVSVD
jgi:hypothetical protein